MQNPINPSDYDTEEAFRAALADDVNRLVKVPNTHSCRATCHKYRTTEECKFGYPRLIIPESEVTEEKVINLKSTDEMI